MKITKGDVSIGNSHRKINQVTDNLLYRALITGIFLAMFLSVLPFTKVEAAGTISGTVYIDYNMNGAMDTSGTAPNYAVDKGNGPVTVTVYDSNGVQQGTGTAAANGTYSIIATGTGPYRVEFSSLPSGYFPSSVGTNNDSAVQFVPNGNSSGVDFGIVSQKEYCQNNPDLVTNCYINGNETNGDVLINFPYSAGAPTTTTTKPPYENPTTHSIILDQTQIGPTWGLAYARKTKRIYAAAYFKKHTNFGPGGPDAIYKINPEDNSVVQTIAVPGATTNSHGTTDVCAGPQTLSECDNGNIGWDAVGKTALGGMAISDDEASIYVMNLQNRTLYELNAVTGVATRWQSMPGVPNVSGSVTNLSSSGNLPPGAAGSATNVRPFAVSYLGDKIYVGIVSSAETSPATLGNLQAHIYEIEPSTFVFTRRLTIPLNYNRGAILRRASNGQNNPAEWNAWRTTFATVGTMDTGLGALEVGYPQPVLTGIDFDDNENLVVGIRDRAGDQLGHFTHSDPSINQLYIGESAGDALKACGNQTSGWTLENNSRCGGQGNGSQNNGQGLGDGEFYYGDMYNDGSFSHDETVLGGLEQISGRPNIAMTVFDPASLADQSGAFSAGAKWFNNSQGNAPRSYNLYSSSFTSSDTTFAKANGLGDLISLCDAAPLQVGNRVWNDANSNGIQDPGEASIQNVDVELWADTTGDGTPDTQVGTTTTDANGNYIFGGVSNTNLGTYSCGTPTLQTVTTPISSSTDDGYQLNSGTIGDRLTRNEVVSGGVIGAAGFRFQNVNIPQGTVITNAYIQFTANNGTNTSGSPTYTITGDDYVNAPVYSSGTNGISVRPDLGGGVTWNVPTWSTAGESGANQRTPALTSIVQTQLNRATWASGNAMSFTVTSNGTTSRRDIESFDGNAASAARLVIEYNAPAICTREVEPDTAYEVRIPSSNFSGALSGFTPTSSNNDNSSNGDSRDSDGIVVSGSQVFAPFTTGSNGQNNHSYDFGFRAGATSYSVGNRIWYDTDNDGIIDSGEQGISGVSVSIFLDNNGDGNPDTPGSPINTITTDADGYYRFDSLAADSYVIRVNSSNFAGGTLQGYQNTANSASPIDDGIESSGAGSNAENGIDPANGGDVFSDGILSNSFALGGLFEPSSEADVPSTGSYAGQGSFDNRADMTVDFGFYKLTLSGTVWSDTGFGVGENNNGQLDSGENMLIGYRTRLYDSANNEIPVGADGILGTADDGLGGMLTDGSGNYSFMGMPAGDYRVVVNSNGGVSSTPTENDPDTNGDSNDNGFPDNTGNFPTRIISGIVTLTPGNVGAMSNNSVNNANALTSNPTVDFGLLLAPTMVKLDKFEAYFDGNNVVVEWSTGDEAGNLGFNVYRQSKGQKELLTNAPVAGSALKTTVDLKVKGNSYRWIDKQSDVGSVYYLEDIDVNGTRTMHGPIHPNVKFDFDYTKQNSSKLLTDLIKTEVRSTQKEFVGDVSSTGFENDSLRILNSNSNSDKQREVAAMSGVKLFVKDAGWYRIELNSLAQAGFDTNSDKSNWQLFANGIEIPMQIGYNRYSDSSTVEFYGQGVDTNATDEQVYYLVRGEEAGLRLSTKKGGNAEGPASAESYETTVQRKDRSLYLSSLLNGEKENWFGPIISTSSETLQDLTANNPFDDGVNQARLQIKLQGLTNVNHLVSVSFNNVLIGTSSFVNKDNETFEFDIPMSLVVDGQNLVGLQSVGEGSDFSLVDSVSLRYSRRYVAKDDYIHFVVPAGQTVRIGGFSDGDISILELDNGKPVRELGIESEKVNGTPGLSLAAADYNRELIAVDRFTYSGSISRIEANNPSTWNASSNEADFVIITPNSLKDQAEVLADMRQSQGLKTVVVDIEDIYDEYNFGRRSAQAIKEFLQDASSNWTQQPGYVLLFGDSSYDQRNYLNQIARDLIPTKLIDTQFMETSSDGWLADFDNDGVEDMSLGRIPVVNTAEATQMVAKLGRYDQQEERLKTTDLLIADNFFEGYSNYLESFLPEDTEAVRVDRSQMSDVQMRARILLEIKENPMVVTYTGHGATGIWVNANVLKQTDVSEFSNDKLAFFMLMTCLNGFTHNPYGDSLAETLLKAENGAIAVWASSGSTYASGQIFMSQKATQDLFADTDNSSSVGDLTRAAKLTTSDMDARRTWQLIGDPTIVIK